MNATDRRHGTYAGYQAHVHAGESPVTCWSCLVARRRRDKRNRVRAARGIPALVDGRLALAAVDGWLHMGVSATVLDTCLGHYGGGIVVRLLSGEITSVRLSTLARLRAVDEDMLPGSARVYADLTRYRVFSLMAAGHEQQTLGINPNGRWRSGDRLTLAHARQVREMYRRLQYSSGPNANTASRQRNRGVLVPAGWDDPDTLAWPRGFPRPGDPVGDDPGPVVDDAAIWRRMHGDRTVPLTQPEQDQLVACCREAGWGWDRIERDTGVNVRRVVRRLQEVA